MADQKKPPARSGGGFKDAAHTSDKVSVQLIRDEPPQRCTGPSATVGVDCSDTEYPSEEWCEWCRSNPELN